MVTTTRAITEGTTMAIAPTHKRVANAVTVWRERGYAVSRGHYGALCSVLVMMSLVAPAYAADATAGGAAGNAGYYGQFYEPGEAAAAAPPPRTEDKASAVERQRSRRYVAPDAYGLLYQPGFGGCAPDIRVDSIGGLRSALVPLLVPLSPVQERNPDRYFRLGLSVAETYTD